MINERAVSMQKIAPHLWFDKEAKEAAEFYVSTFGGNSKVEYIQQIHDTPSGSVDIVGFQLLDRGFMAISAGPLFKFNPSVSFFVGCTTMKEVDTLWEKLSSGGTVLMELGEYPFSRRYGWCADRYGLSWQLILTDPTGDERPRIVPSLLFVGDVCGKAEEAIKFYLSVFRPSKLGSLHRYPGGGCSAAWQSAPCFRFRFFYCPSREILVGPSLVYRPR
jgi:predicted 3-demethylubiquinone-9 3-methyltransferase (glyoxalase superfamily)